MKVRFAYTKKNEARYIAHLDLMRVLDRALRRAGVDVAYSEGFNPHPKIAFGPPLPVGVQGQKEYVDIDLKLLEADAKQEETEEVSAWQNEFLAKAATKIQEELPEGIKIVACGVRPQGDKALMAVINHARYLARVPFLEPIEAKTLAAKCQNWLLREEVVAARIQKGKRVERNIRPFVKAIYVVEQDQNNFLMQFDMVTGNSGSVRPSEVLESLSLLENLPVDFPGIITNREGVYIQQSDGTLRDLIG